MLSERRWTVTALVLFASAGFGVGCDDTPDPSGARALVDDWVQMWNSYDLDRVEELFLTDERLTYFSSEREGVIKGFPAVLAHHEGFGFVPGGRSQGSRLWLEEVRLDLFEETAVGTGIWYFQGAEESESVSPGPEEEAGGTARGLSGPQRGPVTFVCVEEDGRWRFVHMSFSEYLEEESQSSLNSSRNRNTV